MVKSNIQRSFIFHAQMPIRMHHKKMEIDILCDLKTYISNYYTFHPFSVYAVNIQGFHGIPVLVMLILTFDKGSKIL